MNPFNKLSHSHFHPKLIRILPLLFFLSPLFLPPISLLLMTLPSHLHQLNFQQTRLSSRDSSAILTRRTIPARLSDMISGRQLPDPTRLATHSLVDEFARCGSAAPDEQSDEGLGGLRAGGGGGGGGGGGVV
jgi:hypothetical protein